MLITGVKQWSTVRELQANVYAAIGPNASTKPQKKS
jgi:hypothetical protein